MLEFVRTRAIQEGIPFILDAEIITSLGKRRWVRITASVEYENQVPVRIFGTKQDVTEEKAGQGRSETS
jgi:PAS domain-containing protein